MGKWFGWNKVANGPYEGTPKLGAMGLGSAGYDMQVRNRAGDVIQITPAMPGRTGATFSMGGAGTIAHMPEGHWFMGGRLAVGTDSRLYSFNYETYRWEKVSGPGRFLSPVYSSGTMDGYMQVVGEGKEHQLAYAFVKPEESKANKIDDWDDLGQPGEAGGKKGINGRPAVVQYSGNMHILVRGQDNHLWYLHGKITNHQKKAKFGRWTNLGGGITQPPVAITTGKGIEVFVVGEQKEVHVNTWDGKKWSGFEKLGGQLKGLPVALSILGGDSTYVFGRGVHDKLWYRRRTGKNWSRWQAVGEKLSGDPALWQDTFDGSRTVSVVVLREKGQLWERKLTVTRDEYAGQSSKKLPAGDTKVQYTVQAGDWLYRIARGANVDVSAIKAANRGARNWDRLDAGQKLTIPMTAKGKFVSHTVQPGDTLGRIAGGYGVTAAQLMRNNNIKNADRINIGATIKIPVG